MQVGSKVERLEEAAVKPMAMVTMMETTKATTTKPMFGGLPGHDGGHLRLEIGQEDWVWRVGCGDHIL